MDTGTGEIFIQRIGYGGATTHALPVPLTSLHTATQNFDFSLWETQDQLLLSWLQSSSLGAPMRFNFGRSFTLTSTPKLEPKLGNFAPSYVP